MTLARLAEALAAYPKRPALIVAGLLGLAALWHLCLPAFFYRNAGVFIDGPLPAVAGVALALWLGRADPPLRRALGGCAWGLLALLGSILVFGTWCFGPFQSLPALWGELREGCRLPFSALVELWGSERFVYGFWSGFQPVLLWGAVAYVALSLLRPVGPGRLRALVGGLGDQRAFNIAQRQQLKAYRAQYLAALRGGEAPPPVPAGIVPVAGGAGGLVRAHLALKIGLTIAGALGLAGGGWALLGDALKGPLSALAWRGFFGG